jgi:hypothetical protein
VRLSSSTVRPTSRMRGPRSLLTSLRRLRVRADRAAQYRATTHAERIFCLRVADTCEALLATWRGDE